MPQKKDYYQQLIDNIKNLINENKFGEAHKLVVKEITQPYVPQKYLRTLEELFLSISERDDIENIEKKYNQMTKTQLLSEIFDGEKLNVNVLSFFLAKFYIEIEKIDLILFEQIFISHKVPTDSKIFALEQIKMSGINHDFVFNNPLINKEFSLNSQEEFEFDKDHYFVYIAKHLENNLFKEPSLKPLALFTLKLIYDYYFGSRPPFLKEDLAQNLLNYIRGYFDDKILVDEKFVDWVSGLFKFQKIFN